MSLTGNLEIFPMPEVLRLLARSKKTGCLRVDAPGVDGRVYLEGGAISFANTEPDEVVGRALVNSGLTTEDGLRSVVATGGTLLDGLADGVDQAAITDFVREQVVESLYRMRRPGSGEFDFVIDLTPAFATGQQFDAEVAVAESDRRATEWADILDAIEDLDAPIRMVRSLPDENSVTVAAPTWTVLASLEGGTSVRELAAATGLSEFRAARELSGLLRSDLVEVVTQTDAGYRDSILDALSQSEGPASDEAVTFGEPEEAASGADSDGFGFGTPDVQNEPADETGDTGWDASSWETPADDAGEAVSSDSGWFDDAAGDEPAEAEGGVEESDIDGGWWAAATATSDDATDGSSDAESDPDGFLESVFSQLNVDDDGGEESSDEETGFSMGLLRRRRMGASARDITEV